MVCEINHEPNSAVTIEPDMTPERQIGPHDAISPEVEFARADSN